MPESQDFECPRDALELVGLRRTHPVIPDKPRSGADPGAIIELRSPPMDPGTSPG